MAEEASKLLRELPSVDRLLRHSRCEMLLTRYNRDYVTQICRDVVDAWRATLRQGKGASNELSEEAILAQVENRIAAESRPGHVRVINATGTILHTNLGRALLPQAASTIAATKKALSARRMRSVFLTSRGHCSEPAKACASVAPIAGVHGGVPSHSPSESVPTPPSSP